jgi:hypothetical protein
MNRLKQKDLAGSYSAGTIQPGVDDATVTTRRQRRVNDSHSDISQHEEPAYYQQAAMGPNRTLPTEQSV